MKSYFKILLAVVIGFTFTFASTLQAEDGKEKAKKYHVKELKKKVKKKGAEKKGWHEDLVESGDHECTSHDHTKGKGHGDHGKGLGKGHHKGGPSHCNPTTGVPLDGGILTVLLGGAGVAYFSRKRKKLNQ